MKGWQAICWFAAFFNVIVGAPLFMTPEWALSLMDAASGSNLTLAKIIGALLLGFGVVYAIAGRDPVQYRQIAWAGILGKSGVFFVFLPDWVAGTVSFPIVLITLGELAIAVLFVVFLFRLSPDKTNRIPSAAGANTPL